MQNLSGKPLLVIIFSKDRTFQLKETLRSLFESFKHPQDARVVVVHARPGSEDIGKGLQIVKQLFSSVEFIQESFGDCLKKAGNCHCFGRIVHDIVVNSREKLIMFVVDDLIFYRKMVIEDIVRHFENYKDVFTLQTRLGRSINYSFTMNKTINQPNELSIFRRKANISSYLTLLNPQLARGTEWNYPWDLTAGIYRRISIIKILDEIQNLGSLCTIENPNLLEIRGNQIINDLSIFPSEEFGSMISFFDYPICSSLAINRVQETCKNAIYHTAQGEISEINKLIFNQVTKEFDLNYYKNKTWNTIHIGEVKFKDG